MHGLLGQSNGRETMSGEKDTGMKFSIEDAEKLTCPTCGTHWVAEISSSYWEPPNIQESRRWESGGVWFVCQSCNRAESFRKWLSATYKYRIEKSDGRAWFVIAPGAVWAKVYLSWEDARDAAIAGLAK